MRGIGIGLVIGLLLALMLIGARAPLTSSYAGAGQIKNVEEIVWVDWKGRERRMTIHREVHL